MGLWNDLKEGFFGENSPGGFLTGQGARESSERLAREQLGFQEQSREMFRPIVDAGIAQLPALGQSATAEGFGQNLGSILQGGALDPLIAQKQKAAEHYMASKGLRRSGAAVREAGKIPADMALMVENELNRRRQSIAGQGQSGAGNMGNINTMMGQILGRSSSDQAAIATQGQQNAVSLGTAAIGAFSDPRLKDDIKVIDQLDGLDVITWKWNDLAYELHGLSGESTGFNAEQVRELRPDCSFIEDGMLKVDYGKLLEVH